MRGNEELAEPRKAITPTQTRTKLCHSELSAPLPPLTPGKTLILTLAKHAIKHELPPLPTDPGPIARGRGTVTKAPFSPGNAFLIRPLRGDFD